MLPQTDVSRPSALPSANLVPRANNTALGGANQAEQTSREFLSATEEEWNRKIDVELEALLDGMVDLSLGLLVEFLRADVSKTNANEWTCDEPSGPLPRQDPTPRCNAGDRE